MAKGLKNEDTQTMYYLVLIRPTTANNISFRYAKRSIIIEYQFSQKWSGSLDVNMN